MQSRLRVGVIGCGVIAQVMHLPYLRELSDQYEIAAICDLSPMVLSKVGDMYGVARRFTRWEDLIAMPLDAVMILTPGSHAAPAIAAARVGLHVFVEKPLALSVQEGLDVVETAEAAGVCLMVGYMKRYDPAYERLRDRLGDSAQPVMARVTTLESPFQPYVSHYPLATAGDIDGETMRRLQAEDDLQVNTAIGSVPPSLRRAYRSVLLDSLVHELNALRGLLGEPDRIDFAEIWDGGIITVLRFGETRCTVQWVDLPELARYRQEFAFYMPSARAILSFPSPYLRSMPTELTFEGGESTTTHSWRTDEIVSYDEAFKRELMEFHNSVTEERQPRTNGWDGLRDIALSEAIIAVAQGGQPREQPTLVSHTGDGLAERLPSTWNTGLRGE